MNRLHRISSLPIINAMHAMETALLALHKYIISSMDRGKVTVPILLDHSATFVTVNYNDILHHLEH